MQIDILMLTHNNMLTIDRCLDAIATHTKEKYKVYIFDNGSTDKEFLKHLDTISDRKIIIKKNKKNVGVGPGRRALSDMSSGDMLMFLDSDMIVTQHWDRHMLRQFDKFPGTGGVCAKFRQKGTKYCYANGGFYKVENNKYLIVDHYHNGLLIDDIRTFQSISCGFISGGVSMIPQEVNNAVKYPKEGYKVGFEDIDYSFQIKKAGYELYNCPYTSFCHLHDLKNPDYNKTRKDKVEFLLSVALFTQRWRLNPIKSWSLNKTIFKKDLPDTKLDAAVAFANGCGRDYNKVKEYMQHV